MENVPIDIMHGKSLDTMLPQNLLLALVNIAQANVHKLLGAQHVIWLEPAENILAVFLGEAGEKGHGHAVDVAAVRRLGRVDVGMRVDPNDGNVSAEPLADGFGGTGNGANGDGVVAAERQHELAVAGVLVHLVADFARHSAGELGALHAAVVWVVGGL